MFNIFRDPAIDEVGRVVGYVIKDDIAFGQEHREWWERELDKSPYFVRLTGKDEIIGIFFKDKDLAERYKQDGLQATSSPEADIAE